MAELPEKLLRAVNTANLMTPRQRDLVQRDIRVLEGALHGQAMPYFGGDPTAQGYQPGPGRIDAPPIGHVRVVRDMPVPNREDLERNYKACMDTMAAGSAPELSTAAKNMLYQQYKADWIAYQEGMPSHDQMWKPQWQNIQLHVKHKEANAERGKRLQNIHRILEPNDDGFHLEALRPEKPTPYNGAAFRAGYDHIQWSDDKDLELQIAELDDGTYFEFLQLKAAGITARKIFEDKLAISRQQYEACEARLKASALGQADLLAHEMQDLAEADAARADADRLDDGEIRVTARADGGLDFRGFGNGSARVKPKSKGRPVAPKAVPAQQPLSEKAQAALETYGEMIMLIADEGPIDVNGAAAILQQMAPDEMGNVLSARAKAQMVLRALVVTGQLTKDEKLYSRPVATPV